MKFQYFLYQLDSLEQNTPCHYSVEFSASQKSRRQWKANPPPGYVPSFSGATRFLLFIGHNLFHLFDMKRFFSQHQVLARFLAFATLTTGFHL